MEEVMKEAIERLDKQQALRFHDFGIELETAFQELSRQHSAAGLLPCPPARNVALGVVPSGACVKRATRSRQ
jgi:hypothetical protein